MQEAGEDWLFAMRRGDYSEAWRINACILKDRDPAGRDCAGIPYHLRWVWDGRPFHDRHVLVRCYHGLGDTIQFARYLPSLRRVARSLTVEVQPRLIPLLQSMAGIGRLVPFVPGAPLPASECDMELMEVPFALRMPPEALPPPYLFIRSEALPEGTLGLCWQAGDWDIERSLHPDILTALTAFPCVTLQTWPTLLNVLNPQGCPRDLMKTAALIGGLDVLVTVDTMVAHLAGALNIATCLLLKYDADWRWMSARTDTPWYPSLRLYRQPKPGDWRSVAARVTEDLSARTNDGFRACQGDLSRTSRGAHGTKPNDERATNNTRYGARGAS
jgi:hypothetical protein